MDSFSNITNSTVNTETMSHVETSKQEEYEKHKVE